MSRALAVRGDRITAKATLVRQERDMTRVAHKAILTYLKVVRRAVATTRITAAATDPDDDDLGDDVDLNGLDQSAAWPGILKATILPEVDKILIGLGPQKFMTGAVVNAMNTWRAAWLANRSIALAGVPDTITKLIRDAIQADAQAKGPNPFNAANIVKGLLNPDAPMWKNRAQTIARTEVVGANNQGGVAAYTAIHQSLAPMGGQVFKTWLATEDQFTRPDHADIDGTEVGMDDSFSVGESQMSGPGDESADASETINCRCVPAGTAITSFNVQVGWKRPYAGWLIRLRTTGGYETSVTPNHPIFTATGWVEAGRLREGDHVARSRVRQIDRVLDPDVPHVPTEASELFDALAFCSAIGASERVRGSTVDFHGDGAEGEVEIAIPDHDLTGYLNAVSGEERGHLGLAFAHASMSGQRDSTARVDVSHTDSHGSTSIALHGASTPDRPNDRGPANAQFDSDGGHGLALLVKNSDSFIVADSAPHQAGIVSAPHHPGVFQDTPNRSDADAVLAREGLLAFAGEVTLDDLVVVERHWFTGHVFNFQCDMGAYMADGILTHNCTLTYRIDDGAGDGEEIDADEADASDSADAASDDGDDSLTAAAPEAPVTAPAIAPPQPADGTPSEAAPVITPGPVQWQGVLAELDAPSSDGRMIASAGFTNRTLPLPLKYQAQGEHGGEPAGTTEIVGRILTITVQGTQVMGAGDFFDPSTCWSVSPAMEQVAAGIGGVSVDLPVQVVSYMAPGPNGTLLPIDPMTYMGDPMDMIMVAEVSELAAVTIVDVPAFGSARIELIPDPSAPNLTAVTADAATPQAPVLTADSVTMPDGTVLNVGDQVNIIDATGVNAPTTGLIEAVDPTGNTVTVAVEDPANPGQTNTVTVDPSNLAVVDSLSNDDDSAATGSSTTTSPVLAGAFPALEQEHVYDAGWFEPVALDKPTAITITADGRVYGHLAVFGTCHVGKGECVTTPHSPSGYQFFHVGEALTSSGLIPVGKLTVGGGHASVRGISWRGAAEHYDNAGSAVAVVRAHEDEFGVQVTGALIPTATSDQISALRRSPLSGDWRVIGGQHELVAALSVNVPGFPVPRAAIAASGRMEALVAAGVVHAPAGDGEPVPGGVTLPSGTKLSPDDVAVLAGAWHDVIGQREQAIRDEAARAANVRQLKTGLLRTRLTARV